MSEWRHPFVTSVGVILGVVLAMVTLDMGPSTFVVSALGAALASGRWCINWLGPSVAAAQRRPIAMQAFEAHGDDRRMRKLRSGIVLSGRVDSYSDHLYETLVDLADDQLVTAHGVDRLSDPTAAARILDPELYEFLERPELANRLSRPKYIDHIVTLVEAL